MAAETKTGSSLSYVSEPEEVEARFVAVNEPRERKQEKSNDLKGAGVMTC
jgi:hypothetical protein